MVERDLPKVDVVGSSPITRSTLEATMSRSGLYDILDARSSSKSEKKAARASVPAAGQKTPNNEGLPISDPSVKFHKTRRGKNSFARLVGLL